MTSIYDRVEKRLQAKRDRHERDRRARREEAYKKIPQLRDLDKSIRALGFEATRLLLENPDKKRLDQAQEELSSLEEAKEGLLISQGYPPDYLEVHHDCQACKDQGYLEDGTRCKCYNQHLASHLYKMSNMEAMIKKENFASFDLDRFSSKPFGQEDLTPRENMEDILKTVRVFIETFDEANDMNMLFYGPTGQGKTFLSNCIARELLDRSHLVIYQTAFTLLDILEKRKFHSNKEDPQNDLQYDLLFDCDLLIIDDLGTEMSNRFTHSEIFNIVNTRLIKSKKTLISTNLSPGEISRTYSDRIFSRVFEKFVPVKFYGPDLRWEEA